MLSKKPIAVFKMPYKRFMALADGGDTNTHTMTHTHAPIVNNIAIHHWSGGGGGGGNISE